MRRYRLDSNRDGGGPPAWVLFLAIPGTLFCCGGPFVAGALGTGALATFAVALLVLVGGAALAQHLRRGAGTRSAVGPCHVADSDPWVDPAGVVCCRAP